MTNIYLIKLAVMTQGMIVIWKEFYIQRLRKDFPLQK